MESPNLLELPYLASMLFLLFTSSRALGLGQFCGLVCLLCPMGSCSKSGAMFTYLCRTSAWNVAGAQRVFVETIELLDKERAGGKVRKTDFCLIS